MFMTRHTDAVVANSAIVAERIDYRVLHEAYVRDGDVATRCIWLRILDLNRLTARASPLLEIPEKSSPVYSGEPRAEASAMRCRDEETRMVTESQPSEMARWGTCGLIEGAPRCDWSGTRPTPTVAAVGTFQRGVEMPVPHQAAAGGCIYDVSPVR
jgi:hypothetical protein